MIALFLLVSGTFWPAAPTAAQDEIQVLDQGWEGQFRDHLTFKVKAQSADNIESVNLVYRIVGQLATSRNEAEFTPGPEISAQFTLDQTNPVNYMPPGTEVEYWWKITDAAGNELKMDKQTLTYLDNRYDWQTLENDRLTLYWHSGEDTFGQALFDRANVAMDTLQQDIGVALERPIKIFIYGTHNDLMGAIATTAQEWTGGQAFAEHGVVVIGIEPRQLEWGLNAMTHEMTHLLVHQATDNPYGDMPVWLDEGIAVYNENKDELVEDFRPAFERAVRQDNLMTLRTLSSPFPSDPDLAGLAYGQSGAVVKFIIDHYGTERMAALLNIFAEGSLYDDALEQALGVNTDGLDNAFRASLGLPALPGTEAPAAVEVSTQPTAPAQETEAPAKDAVGIDIKPHPTPASPAEKPNPLAAIPCLAGVVALLVMGGLLHGHRP
jgi:hypothetical protein